MWTWLSEHPTVSKEDYFIVMNISEDDIPNVDCYCCEYATNDQGFRNCTCCPIFGSTKISEKNCLDLNSPYLKWATSVNSNSKAYYANKIVKLAQKALDDLEV